jgi:hypothetical protein
MGRSIFLDFSTEIPKNTKTDQLFANRDNHTSKFVYSQVNISYQTILNDFCQKKFSIHQKREITLEKLSFLSDF